ncbi:hypothetical protein E2C01_077794 [Portunus trituberculatus]|uniref:Uncharacterized protein n=1 Tax=Portunus trituberculatus TaxID=210409 RepID=A0A5B7IL42_PORTR|nr:hypothetical protein [Portunus trituberculatus]
MKTRQGTQGHEKKYRSRSSRCCGLALVASCVMFPLECRKLITCKPCVSQRRLDWPLRHGANSSPRPSCNTTLASGYKGVIVKVCFSKATKMRVQVPMGVYLPLFH